MSDKIEEFSGPYRFLSNFWPSEVEMDGEVYPTVEHAYQAAKTTDERERERIRHLATASNAKSYGKKVALRPDWDNIKDGVMEFLVRKKFTENKYLRISLLATEDMELIEGNWWGDEYWGVCNGNGMNKLGAILMKIRSELQKSA